MLGETSTSSEWLIPACSSCASNTASCDLTTAWVIATHIDGQPKHVDRMGSDLRVTLPYYLSQKTQTWTHLYLCKQCFLTAFRRSFVNFSAARDSFMFEL